MTLIDQLVRDEGLRLHPYIDSVGKLTIGVGRNLTDMGISQAETEMLLSNDIANAGKRREVQSRASFRITISIPSVSIFKRREF